MIPNSRFMQLIAQIKPNVQCCTAQEALAALQSTTKPVLIDVREGQEWQAGHIRGAIHLSRGILELQIERAVPDTTTPILLYCGGGHRSALAAYNLKQMGYNHVTSMDGGYGIWQKLGYPVE